MNESSVEVKPQAGDTSMAKAFRAKIAKVQAEENSKIQASMLDITEVSGSPKQSEKLSPRSKR